MEGRGGVTKPLTDVESKWQFELAICSLQGVASSSWRLLQLLQHVACHGCARKD